MKSISFFSLVIGVLLLNSCSTPNQMTISNDPIKILAAPTDKALVYIMRPSIYGFAFSFSLSCKDKDLGDLYSKRFTYFFAEPSTYTFLGKGENKDDIILTLEAGKIYFLETLAQMGLLSPRIKWQRLNEPDGRKKLSKCSLPNGFTTPILLTNTLTSQ